jgi:hypothetical protein
MPHIHSDKGCRERLVNGTCTSGIHWDCGKADALDGFDGHQIMNILIDMDNMSCQKLASL